MDIKALAIAQDKLKAIDKLSNIIQKLDKKEQKDEVAYLIHQIIELPSYIDSNISRQILSWQIEANKDLFVTVQ